jgi:hypothetical protein
VTVQRVLDWSVDIAAIDRGRILSGRRRPTFGTLRAICVALELPLQAAITFSAGDSAVLPARYVNTEVSRLG